MPARKILLSLFAGFMVVAGAGCSPVPVFRLDRTITLHDKKLYLEFAETESAVKQGLSDRASMSDDQGMVFFLGRSDIHAFWMYHMHFPLDIVWLQDGVVTEIAENMRPPSETLGIPATHVPQAKANEVLELTAGGAERYKLKVGSSIDF